MAERIGFATLSIEARENTSLASLLIPNLRKILLRLSSRERFSNAVHRGLRVLKSFAGSLKGKATLGDGFDVELGIEPERGSADSGDLEHDLGELLLAVAEAAASENVAICLLIDELQYLSEAELSALIVALHQVSQRQLPLVLFAAGLPLILSLAGKSKSYSERLFAFSHIGHLDRDASARALTKPLATLDVIILPDALEAILEQTGRYPYFLQQWGYETWNVATGSPISKEAVERASDRAIRQLDESFFRVRFDHLTKREKDFLFAMVRVGGESQRTGEIADELHMKAPSIAPLRSNLIKKGMIYSPSHGDNVFTVPLFDGFLRRQLRQVIP